MPKAPSNLNRRSRLRSLVRRECGTSPPRGYCRPEVLLITTLAAAVCLWRVDLLAQSTGGGRVQFDDPMASLSSEDDLDEIIRQGFKINHLELIVHRCAMGANRIDKAYRRRKEQMESLHLLWGAYMYPDKETKPETASTSGINQARHFLKTVLKHRRSDSLDHVVLSLSWFWRDEREIAPSPTTIVSICQEIHRLTGTWPLLFVDIDLLEALVERNELTVEQKATLGNCDLWLSVVHSEHSFPVLLPAGSPWPTWTFCLYTAADDPMTKNAASDTIVPDLSYFAPGRGKPLQDWYSAHSWNYVSKAPIE